MKTSRLELAARLGQSLVWACVLVVAGARAGFAADVPATAPATPVAAPPAPGSLALPPAEPVPADAVQARQLLDEAKSLFAQRDFASACPKLAQSYRLAPLTGTLLALATCHEQLEDLTAAWSEFVEAKGRAQSEGHPAREQNADSHLQALRSRLSFVLVVVDPEVGATPGLQIDVGSALLTPAQWNSEVPLQVAQVVVTARAPGRRAWAATRLVPLGTGAVRIAVPPLARSDEGAAVAPATSALVAGVPQISALEQTPTGGIADDQDPENLRPLQWVGLISGGLGAVSLGVGAAFLASALARNGKEAGAEAQGNRATAFAIAGTALLATGVTLYFVGSSDSRDRSSLSLSVQAGRVSSALLLSGAL